MGNDDTNDASPDQAPDFNTIPWHVLIGIRGASDPANPSNMTEGLLFGMACTPEAMVDTKQGSSPDKTREAVHFAQWFDRNKEHLVALWRTEYSQYMNLRMMTERGVPGLRIAGANELPGDVIIGSDGRPMQ